MTLRTRFILTIGGVALLLVVPALYAAHQLSELRTIATKAGATHGSAYLAMGRFQARLADVNRLERSFVALGTRDIAVQRDAAMDEARSHLEQLAGASYGEVSEAARTHLLRIESEIIRLDAMRAAGDSTGASEELELLKPLFADADSILAVISREIDRRSDGDLRAARRISATALTTTLLALVACVFIAILLGTWATHTVVRPIQRLRRVTAAVAAGEFVVPDNLPYERTDEIGDLSRSFRGMTQQLADLDRMKADFMSIATHELKTPINVITGYAELIQEGVYGETTDKQLVALTSIQEQARMLTQLVNQLLDISRLEAGGLRLEINDMIVSDLFERVRRTFEVLAHKQRIELSVELERTAPRSVPADGDRLRDQVLGNLLANALKFTPEGGRIGVRGWGEDGQLLIEVSDTGAGMPADQLPHVFDKYFQIGEQARSKGAGLGLTIAHDIVEAHGGEITVTSVEGEGTVFRIALPTKRGADETPRKTPQGVATRG